MKSSPQAVGNSHAVKCELAGEVLRSSGVLRLQVTGWSMLPTVWPGDTLVLESVTSDDVSVGDIVLFGRDRRLFAHRVVTKNVENSGVLTRGDAMPAPDPVVGADELLGRVSFILRNGRCIAPRRSLRFSERAIATVVRSSDLAARVVVGVHGMRQTLQSQTTPVS